MSYYIGILQIQEILEKVKYIQASNNNSLVFKLIDETEVTKKWKNKPKSESWTSERRELARRR